jgi:hypothetical protein
MAARSASDDDATRRGDGNQDQFPSTTVGADPQGGPLSFRLQPDERGPLVSDERWETIHPKLLEVFLERLFIGGEVIIGDAGLMMFYDQSEPRS